MLRVKGIDLVDQTPILDIKPYLPYCESLPEATGGFAAAAPQPTLQITWSPEAVDQLNSYGLGTDFQALANAVLSQDPRPAYQQGQNTRPGGIVLHQTHVRYSIEKNQLLVVELKKVI